MVRNVCLSGWMHLQKTIFLYSKRIRTEKVYELVMKKVVLLMTIALFLCVIPLPIIGSSQTDWPMYAYDSANTGYSPSSAPEKNTTFLEKQVKVTSGLLLSSPILVNGKLYIVSAQGLLLCVDAYSGDIFWEKELGNFPTTPAVDNNFLYIGNSTGVVCFVASEEDPGEPEWIFPCGTVLEAPTVVNSMIYFGCNKDLYCINTDGTEQWKVSADYSISSPPAVENNYIYFASSTTTPDSSILYCLDGKNNGTEEWRYGRTTQTTTAPAVSDGNVFVGSWDTMLSLNALVDDIDNPLVPNWEYQTLGNPVTSASVDDSNVYFGSTDNTMYCVNSESGELVWQYLTEGKIQTPAVADGKVYASTFDGTVYCFDATDTGFGRPDVLWTFDTEQTIRTQPAIADNRVWVVTDNFYVYGFYENHPPKTPDQPYGVSQGIVNIAYSYTTKTTDSDGDDVWYKADFGDEETDWLGPFVSGESIQISHIWTTAGTYNVQMRARDSSDEESSWSSAFAVQIAPKSVEERAWVFGVVVDSSGAELNNVQVCLINEEEISHCDYTDTQGLYQIEVTPGSYTMHALKDGFTPGIVSDVIVLKDEAIEVDITLEQDISSAETDETILAEYAVQHAIDAGRVGATITIPSATIETDPLIQYYADEYTIDIIESEEIISFTVSAEDAPGRFFIIFIDDDVVSNSKIKVTFDEEVIEKMSISYFLNPQESDQSGYVVLSASDGIYACVWVPYFSTHTITIESVMEGIGGVLAVLFYILILSIIGIVYFIPIWFVQKK